MGKNLSAVLLCPTCGHALANPARDREIGQLTEQGVSLAEIGRQLGIDRRRVWQILHYRVRKDKKRK
jgi:hypothetical protein